jgi:hypothetical protein
MDFERELVRYGCSLCSDFTYIIKVTQLHFKKCETVIVEPLWFVDVVGNCSIECFPKGAYFIGGYYVI